MEEKKLVAGLDQKPALDQKEDAATLLSFKHDKVKSGWTLLEDVPFDGKRFVPEIVKFQKEGEFDVTGAMMKQRAKEFKAHLGQKHAEYLLDHQELIPKEWRGKYCLVFPGTVWQDFNGDRYVSYLDWDENQWRLCFSWLRFRWDDTYRLVARE